MADQAREEALVAWADRLVAPKTLLFGAARFLVFLLVFTFLWMETGLGAKVHGTLIGTANALLEAVESKRSHTVIKYEPDPSKPGQTRAVEYKARNKVKAKFNHRLTYTLGVALALCVFLPHRPWPKGLIAFVIVAVSMLLMLFVETIGHAYHVLGVKLAGDGSHAASFSETSLLMGLTYVILPALANAAGWCGSGWIWTRCKKASPVTEEPVDA